MYPTNAKPGDVVVVWSGDTPQKLAVAATTKTSITLSDNTRWTRCGRRWGSASDAWYRGPRISIYEGAKDDERIEREVAECQRRRLKEQVRRIDFSGLTADQLTRILAIANEPTPTAAK